MDFEKTVTLAVPALFVVLVAMERWRPARPLPRVPGWRWKGVAFFLVAGAVSALVPALCGALLRPRLLHLEDAGVVPTTIVGFVAVELFLYAWHRLRHATFLWRVHQLHHSAERVDMFGATFSHPLDLASTNLVIAAVATVVLGLGSTAAALVGFLVTACAFFQHANVRTPVWLGYLVQRPEAHSVHHARGIHAGNYCDLPLWDLVFGTFKNPARFEAEAGFHDGASRELCALLIGRDVAGGQPHVEDRPNRPVDDGLIRR